MHPNCSFDFPITCSCGKSYSRDAWTTLSHDGVQSGYHEGKRFQFFEDLEMRRCVCGSTMSVPIRLLSRQRDDSMIHRCRHFGSGLSKIRSIRTGIEYCLQCGAAVNGEQYERLKGEKMAGENDTRSEVDDTRIDT
jgi:hypothetical protein